MPSKSKSQQRLMQAAEHGANFPMARRLRQSMTHQQLHDFAMGSMTGKPEHVKASPAPKAAAPKKRRDTSSNLGQYLHKKRGR